MPRSMAPEFHSSNRAMFRFLYNVSRETLTFRRLNGIVMRRKKNRTAPHHSGVVADTRSVESPIVEQTDPVYQLS